MSISTADFYKGFATAWAASGLNTTFKSYWDDPTSAEFPVLHDQEASPDQPFPYVVMDRVTPKTTSRMSGAEGFKYETRDVVLRLNVHAAASGVWSAKEVAALLVSAVMEKFGGHPTVAATPRTLTLENGHNVLIQYQNDWGVRTGDDEYQWIIELLFRLDVPVAV